MNTPRPDRPVLRYFGGKWRLAPWIISHFPAHRVYTEVFGGAASVLMQKSRSPIEVYNDLDQQVFNLFRVLRDDRPELERLLRLTPYSRDEYQLSQEPADCRIEQARRTLVRSWFSIGTDSIHRATLAGFRGTTDDAKVGTIPLHQWAGWQEQLERFQDRLSGVLIENDDASAVLTRNDYPDALHYVDPPYVPDTRSSGGYLHEMTTDDHEQLAETMHNLSGMIVLSGYRCEMYDSLFSSWKRIDRTALADSRTSRTESIWLNPAAQAMQPQQSLFQGVAA